MIKLTFKEKIALTVITRLTDGNIGREAEIVFNEGETINVSILVRDGDFFDIWFANGNLATGVNRSVFKPAKFQIEVTRTESRMNVFEVEALDENDAKELAMEEASDYDFSQNSAIAGFESLEIDGIKKLS